VSLPVTVRAALIQLDCSTTQDVATRTAQALATAERAAAEADIVVLPELWHVGAFDVDAAREHAQPIDGPLVSALAGKSSASFPIPVAIVPGHLEDEEIDALA